MHTLCCHGLRRSSILQGLLTLCMRCCRPQGATEAGKEKGAGGGEAAGPPTPMRPQAAARRAETSPEGRSAGVRWARLLWLPHVLLCHSLSMSQVPWRHLCMTLRACSLQEPLLAKRQCHRQFCLCVSGSCSGRLHHTHLALCTNRLKPIRRRDVAHEAYGILNSMLHTMMCDSQL